MKHNLYFESWGRFPKVLHRGIMTPNRVDEINDLIQSSDSMILPRGLGRSYGDSCLNGDGYLLSTKWLNKFYAFDDNTGLLKCEAGVTLDEILQIFVPRGWFLPVTPGTKFVTVGGAVANDIHGKNHHTAGTFGNQVIRFELLRSDGTKLLCSRETNPDWFKSTIGGLGLTGVITWAELTLKPIKGPYIDMESIKFSSLDEFFSISRESEHDYEYIVSWLDCVNSADIRGVFMRGNHSDQIEADASKMLHSVSTWKTFPVDAPSFLLSTATVKLFNMLYYHKQMKKREKKIVHYDPFFYPLDGINDWNRMYGNRGFLQWQCVVPVTKDNEAIRTILSEIIKSGLSSFLVVLKEFGNIPPCGMLSFPMPGITLAVDFPNVGKHLFSLFDRLDKVVIHSDGRLYPAKDARMSADTFAGSFQDFDNFKKYIDPRFSSSFYRRISGENNG